SIWRQGDTPVGCSGLAERDRPQELLTYVAYRVRESVDAALTGQAVDAAQNLRLSDGSAWIRCVHRVREARRRIVVAVHRQVQQVELGEAVVVGRRAARDRVGDEMRLIGQHGQVTRARGDGLGDDRCAP